MKDAGSASAVKARTLTEVGAMRCRLRATEGDTWREVDERPPLEV